ncbi:hypothetical protein D1872_244220 [compost metagenome]
MFAVFDGVGHFPARFDPKVVKRGRCEVGFGDLLVYRIAERKGDADRFSQICLLFVGIHPEGEGAIVFRHQRCEHQKHQQDAHKVSVSTRVLHFSPFLHRRVCNAVASFWVGSVVVCAPIFSSPAVRWALVAGSATGRLFGAPRSVSLYRWRSSVAPFGGSFGFFGSAAALFVSFFAVASSVVWRAWILAALF